MTPPARLAAAIEVLDRILAGTPVEQALTNWGRGSRFAGSGDRAAVRDLVFDALRCRRSFAALGGGGTGRGLVLGGLRAAGQDAAALFTGIGHAPMPPGPDEAPRPATEAERLDCPDWLLPLFHASLGDRAAPVLEALRHRAPVFLRVNLARASRPQVLGMLAEEGIAAAPRDLADSALQVLSGARKIQTSQCYLTGLVELQDAASQAVVEALPLAPGDRVLDYCAGGGGKTLALAGRARLDLFAHDADPRRLRDLPVRAQRAGARVRLTADPARDGPFALVLADAPCSGSGSWRRDPAGKWALTPERLAALVQVQAAILDALVPLVAPRGHLAYATCSLLEAENAAQIGAFLARTPGWIVTRQRQFTPLDGGDGFFISILTRI